ncbi:MAG: hypothetical protein LBI71_02315 [Enterobacteriaceae bacterium]|jgi:predicted permease|nr:hypothetical protein [Enterobacteriaceae bacterium]
MNQIIIILWPLFALIFLGFILKRNAMFTPLFWQGTEKLNYFLLFPALLITSLVTAPLDDPQLFQLVWVILAVLGICCVILIFLTRQMNGNSQLMSAIITLQTIIAAITLPVILGLLLG